MLQHDKNTRLVIDWLYPVTNYQQMKMIYNIHMVEQLCYC